MKVLIIDDSPDALLVAKARLAKEELDVVCAEGGAVGLETAREEMPDLILLDVDMPDMSGFDVCRALKADAELCMIPVLFLSGSITPEDKVLGLDLGAVDYVVKPFDAFELRARVRAALRTKHLQDLLIEHAHIDPLTGLPNRRALMERMRIEWARIERHGGQMSFIMADLDHFKDINDRFGHQVGDKLLQETAAALAGQCRQTDLPARYGGEELAIVVPDEIAENAAHLAERCRRKIEKSCVVVHNGLAQITASFGIADSRGLESPEALIQRADEALYRAKEAGRNRLETHRSEPCAESAAAPVEPTDSALSEMPAAIP
ncbi:MAG: diguanylate cyclase [Thermoguttaceae bacterium]